MKTIFKNAKIKGIITDITVENGKITSLEKTSDEGYDLKGAKVYPGLIDIHIHGCLGYDYNDNRQDIVAKFLADNGITSYLATTSTTSHETLMELTHTPLPQNGANCLGYHLEGPYINHSRKGAQNPDNIQKPDIEKYKQYKNVKMITVAPEIDGGMDFIRECDSIVCIGHTDADYDTTVEAIKSGAKCLTHTFNAMPPLNHRNPGVVGGAITENAYVQVISDGYHLHPAVVYMLYKIFGTERMVLISDAISACGLPNGEYVSGELPIIVDGETGKLTDGTIAGSIAPLSKCVRKAIEFGIPEEDAFHMASTTPAELLGINKGRLEVGFDADFIAVDEEYNIVNTIIGGKLWQK